MAMVMATYSSEMWIGEVEHPRDRQYFDGRNFVSFNIGRYGPSIISEIRVEYC